MQSTTEGKLRSLLVKEVFGLDVEVFTQNTSEWELDHGAIDEANKALNSLSREYPELSNEHGTSSRIVASPDGIWEKGKALRFFGLAEGDSKARVFEARLDGDDLDIKTPYFNRPNFLHVITFLEQGGESASIDYLYRAKAIRNGVKIPCSGVISKTGVPGFLCEFRRQSDENSDFRWNMTFAGALGAHLKADGSGNFKIEMGVYEEPDSFMVGFDLPGMPAWLIKKTVDDRESLSLALDRNSQVEKRFFEVMEQGGISLVPARVLVPKDWYFTEFFHSGDNCPKLCACPDYESLHEANMKLAMITGEMVMMNFDKA